MRKVLFLLLMLVPMVMNAKRYALYCETDQGETGGAFYENDSVRFEFGYIPGSYCMKVKVINKLNEKITVAWENTRLLDKQICFGTDNIFTFNEPKPDELIYGHSSTRKEIAYREGENVNMPFREKSVKERGYSFNEIILPIKFSSGIVKDYKIYLYLKYE